MSCLTEHLKAEDEPRDDDEGLESKAENFIDPGGYCFEEIALMFVSLMSLLLYREKTGVAAFVRKLRV